MKACFCQGSRGSPREAPFHTRVLNPASTISTIFLVFQGYLYWPGSVIQGEGKQGCTFEVSQESSLVGLTTGGLEARLYFFKAQALIDKVKPTGCEAGFFHYENDR